MTAAPEKAYKAATPQFTLAQRGETSMWTAGKIFEYKKQVLEHHLDTYGHVNNAVYLQIYEEARWEISENAGWGWQKVMEEKIGPVVLAANITYKKELHNREWITITTQFKTMRNSLVDVL
ncbi:MAG: acyl-CoA thioesterase [Bacteriovoracaceae bacterium]|nr:acyl-CoA thioesterase [Bacteriovoracaceae bacterium]